MSDFCFGGSDALLALSGPLNGMWIEKSFTVFSEKNNKKVFFDIELHSNVSIFHEADAVGKSKKDIHHLVLCLPALLDNNCDDLFSDALPVFFFDWSDSLLALSGPLDGMWSAKSIAVFSEKNYRNKFFGHWFVFKH